MHQLQRAIYYRRVQPERGRRRDELKVFLSIVFGWRVEPLFRLSQFLGVGLSLASSSSGVPNLKRD